MQKVHIHWGFFKISQVPDKKTEYVPIISGFRGHFFFFNVLRFYILLCSKTEFFSAGSLDPLSLKEFKKPDLFFEEKYDFTQSDHFFLYFKALWSMHNELKLGQNVI